MNNIVLTRKIKVQKYQMKAQFGYFENKQMFQSIIELFYEKQSGGTVDRKTLENEVAFSLLFRPETPIFASRLIDRLQEIKCIEVRDGMVSVTEVGNRLRETGTVAIPAEDVFEISFIIGDPIIPAMILHKKTIEISKANENTLVSVVLNRGNQGKSDHKFEKLPLQVRSLINSEFQLLNKQRVILLDISDEIIPILSNETVTIKLSLARGAGSELEISDDKSSLDITALLNQFTGLSYDSILQQHIKSLNYRYDHTKSAVMLNIGQVEEFIKNNESCLKLFSANFDTKKIEIYDGGQSLGSFESAKLNLIILPLDDTCATIWGKFLLKDLLYHYVSSNQYDEILYQIKLNGPFAGYHLDLPEWDDAITDLDVKYGTKQYWYLQAKRDLIMEVEL